ncbi:Protein OS-9 [Coemansia biformis]|uniref:Protein OS-9 homolog n=1 Tax=Coemansia biformis TaxID=1286918 RepID=A0A9W8CVZ5_9FUNG|nr:Protein OS-9 [Coemansia biformis]
MKLHFRPLGLWVPLLAAAGAVCAASDGDARVFSPVDIMDDVYEVPRFQIRMLDEPIPASKLGSTVDALKSLAREAEHQQPTTEENKVDEDGDDTAQHREAPPAGANVSALIYDPIVANAGNKWRFLCQVPRLSSIRRAMAAELAAQVESSEKDEHAEEQEAIVRGLELLQPLKSACLTYTSGWWTFEYCHGKSVRQFHRTAHDKDGHALEIEYFLGDYSHRRRYPTLEPAASITTAAAAAAAPAPLTNASSNKLVRTTQIHKVGRRHFLVQEWAGGTPCDITREPRDVEIQYHCDPNSPERITLVEEVAICHYVVVINTPRLCVDPGFYDTAASTVFDINCQHVVSDDEYDDLMARDRLLRPPEDDDHGYYHEAYLGDAVDDEGDDGEAEGGDGDGDDDTPLALLGRKSQGLDGMRAEDDDAADKTADRKKGDDKRKKNKKKAQVVISLNDPALIEATHERKEILRRLLALAYGGQDLTVEFVEGTRSNGAGKRPVADGQAEAPAAGDTRRSNKKVQRVHEEL